MKPDKCDIHPDGISMWHTATVPSWKQPASRVKCQRVEGKSGAHILRKTEHTVIFAFFGGHYCSLGDFTQLQADYQP